MIKWQLWQSLDGFIRPNPEIIHLTKSQKRDDNFVDGIGERNQPVPFWIQ
ncbi:MAG: hypothetical protein CM15mV24_1350 [Bellamyvirus sp.]|nr:MAG: hypothetical protein CM15mV24_1350 [Bellamyvirus sp.]